MAHLPLSRLFPDRMVSVAPQARLSMLQRAFGVWRQRQHLSRLPAHLRRDIGLNETEIALEVTRPIWDIPATRQATWRR